MSARALSGLALVAALAASAPTGYAANVSGRVTTPQGIGIPGIDIDVIDAAGTNIELVDDDTDTDGSYDFVVPDGRYRVRFQAAPSQPLVSLQFENWLLTGLVDWQIVMETGARIGGTVRDPSNAPVAGAKLDVVRQDREADVHVPVDETAADGSFSIVVPFGSAITLTAEPPAGTSLLARRQSIGPFTANATLADVALATGHRVQGRVLAGASSVDRVNIDAEDEGGADIPLAHDRTGADGRFEVVLPAGTFRLVARPRVPDALAPVRSDAIVVSGDADVGDLSVVAGRTLSGRVTDASSGAGVADAHVRLQSGGEPVDVSGGRANPAGEYWLVAPPGMYDVVASAPEFRMLDARTITGVTLTADASLDIALLPTTTPIIGITDLLAERTGDRVELSWRVAGLARFDGFRVLRATGSGALVPAHEGWLRPGVSVPGFEFLGSATQGRFRFSDPLPVGAGVAYWLEALNADGSVDSEGPIVPVSTGVTPVPAFAGLRFAPNPSRGQAAIAIRAPGAGDAPHARLEIFDVAGRRLAALPGEVARVAGADLVWELSPSATGLPSAGVVYVRVEVGDTVRTGRLVRTR